MGEDASEEGDILKEGHRPPGSPSSVSIGAGCQHSWYAVPPRGTCPMPSSASCCSQQIINSSREFLSSYLKRQHRVTLGRLHKPQHVGILR